MQALSEAVASTLRALQAKKKLSDQKLSDLVGMDRKRVNRLLNNKVTMDVNAIDMLAQALDSDIETVIKLSVQDAPDRPPRVESIGEAVRDMLTPKKGSKN